MASSDSSDASSAVETWLEWFLIQDNNEFFCEVDRGYIEDTFNLYGLRGIIPQFRRALDILLDRDEDWSMDTELDTDLEQACLDLYGLIHSRYILTKRGMERMLRKYKIAEFGVCPLPDCRGQHVLPVGLSDTLHVHEVMVYCPRCQQVYHPFIKQAHWREINLDGAYFGTTFPHLILLMNSNIVPQSSMRVSRPRKYIPRIFGFKIRTSEEARQMIEDRRKEEAKSGVPRPLPTEHSAEELHERAKRLATVLEPGKVSSHSLDHPDKYKRDGSSSRKQKRESYMDRAFMPREPSPAHKLMRGNMSSNSGTKPYLSQSGSSSRYHGGTSGNHLVGYLHHQQGSGSSQQSEIQYAQQQKAKQKNDEKEKGQTEMEGEKVAI